MSMKPRKSKPKLEPRLPFETPKSTRTTPFYSALSLNRRKVPTFDEYPFSIPAIKSLDELPLHPKVTYFIGENGSGKSTLLEALAIECGFNAEGGNRNIRFSTQETHSRLHHFVELHRASNERPKDGFFLRAESFFNVATYLDGPDSPEYTDMGNPVKSTKLLDAFGRRSLHAQSHGESFFTLLFERLQGEGMYLFDEPEAALSPQRQLSALTRIHQLVGWGSQFIIATHSPILMAYPEAFIYEFSQNGIHRVEYEETEHFRVTRDFLNRREQMLKILLEEDDAQQ